jgi:hypothetical protein
MSESMSLYRNSFTNLVTLVGFLKNHAEKHGRRRLNATSISSKCI